MKNYIYFPLLVALLLCGCKGNSFLTQRYTHFGHSPKKHSETSLAKKTQDKETSQELKKASTLPKAEFIYTSALPEKTVQKEIASPVHSRVIAPLLNTGSNAVAHIKKGIDKTKEQQLRPAKTFQQKAQKAAGLFDTLFKIVLFAIILAILVAVIIILILT